MIEEEQILRLNDFQSRAISTADSIMIWQSNDINPKKALILDVREAFKEFVVSEMPSEELMPPTNLPNNANCPAEVRGYLSTFEGVDCVLFDLKDVSGNNYVIKVTQEQRDSFAHLKLSLCPVQVYTDSTYTTEVTDNSLFNQRVAVVTLHVAFVENSDSTYQPSDVVSITEFVRIGAFRSFPKMENIFRHWITLRLHYVSNDWFNLYLNDYDNADASSVIDPTDYDTQIELTDSVTEFSIDDTFTSTGAGVTNKTTAVIDYNTTTYDVDAGLIVLETGLTADKTFPLVANEKGFQIQISGSSVYYKVPYMGAVIVSYLASTDLWTINIQGAGEGSSTSNTDIICEHSFPKGFDFLGFRDMSASLVSSGVYDIGNINDVFDPTFMGFLLSNYGEGRTEEYSYDTNEDKAVDAEDFTDFQTTYGDISDTDLYRKSIKFYVLKGGEEQGVGKFIINATEAQLLYDGTHNRSYNLVDFVKNIFNDTDYNITVETRYTATGATEATVTSYTIKPHSIYGDAGNTDYRYADYNVGEKVAVLMPIKGIVPVGVYTIISAEDSRSIRIKKTAGYEETQNITVLPVPYDTNYAATLNLGTLTFRRAKKTASLSGRGYYQLTSGQKCRWTTDIKQGFNTAYLNDRSKMYINNTRTENDVRSFQWREFAFDGQDASNHANFNGALCFFNNKIMFPYPVNGLVATETISVADQQGFSSSGITFGMFLKANREIITQKKLDDENKTKDFGGFDDYGDGVCIGYDSDNTASILRGNSITLNSQYPIRELYCGCLVNHFTHSATTGVVWDFSSAKGPLFIMNGSCLALEFEPPF